MNLYVLFLGLGFGLIETAHFGWNALPQSDAEVVCDGIAMLITALAFVAPRKGSFS